MQNAAVTRSMRTVTEKKKSASLLSSYNKRTVDINCKLGALERELYYWIITDSKGPENAPLYDDDIVTVLRGDMKTMRPGSYLSANVINAWSACLNWKEEYRSHDSPSRFFFTTYPCSFTVVDTPPNWDDEQTCKAFYERVDEELHKVKSFKFHTCDLAFFPICHSNHFYVVCIYITHGFAVILDNSDVMKDEGTFVKYGDIPKRVVKLFAKYLRRRMFFFKADNVKSCTIRRLRTPWQSDINKTDCGIYVMRHMETYMGTKANEWDTGLKKRSKKQMWFLRAKYCADILSVVHNGHNVDNIQAATEHFKQCSREGVIDVEKFLMNYVPPVEEKHQQSMTS